MRIGTSLFVLMLVLFNLSCAKFDITDEERWAEYTLGSMTLEEKVGQMITVHYYGYFVNEADESFRKMVLNQIKRNKVGGFIIYGGNVVSLADLLNYMQRKSDLPLLIASDLEAGMGYQISGSTLFPNFMAVSAAQTEEIAYNIGKITATEARAAGIHQVYAPVVDVNNNPYNPIINIRSFGEDPVAVGRLSAAFIKGVQDNGVIATAKHFPGHGDTDIDSHSELPVIDVDTDRLDKIELIPFKYAIDAGVKSVMTAHISIPKISGDTPATLSNEILTGILRNKLNFNGLIITDAMRMKGVADNYSIIDASLKAIKAGTDILLIPPDVELAFDAILKAVKTGEISESRIDSSVFRILKAKAELGLHKNRYVDINRLKKHILKPEFEKYAQEIAEKSLTLLKNENSIIPIGLDTTKKVFAVTINCDYDFPSGSQFLRILTKFNKGIDFSTIDNRTNEMEFEEIYQKANESKLIIIGAFIQVRASKETVEMPEKQLKYIQKLYRLNKPVILVSFSSPYVITQMPETDAYMCTFSSTLHSQKAAAKGILGFVDINGKLPVTIPDYFNLGEGIRLEGEYKDMYSEDVNIVNNLKDDEPENQDFLKKLTGELDEVTKSAIENRVTPGGQLTVGRYGKIVYNKPFGKLTYDNNSEPVTDNHLYDLASLTKVIVATTLTMILYDRELISLNAPVYNYIPEFKGPQKNKVKVINLLTHSSGLPAWEPYYQEVKSKKEMYRKIYDTELKYTPNSKSIYSDLGIILLGNIIEKVTGKPLDILAEKWIFKPLNMENTLYNPGIKKMELCVPTEMDNNFRKRQIKGNVHDENAYSMGGVSAHAGLFSNTEDLSKFCQMMLNKGIFNHNRIIKEETIDLFTKRPNIVKGSSRALGWDTPSYPSSSGDYFSDVAFGHTGFTGTSIWIDPKRDLFVVLLTNRVYPTWENSKIFSFRQKVHNTIVENIVY